MLLGIYIDEFIWDLLFHLIPLYMFDKDGQRANPMHVASCHNWNLVAELLKRAASVASK